MDLREDALRRQVKAELRTRMRSVRGALPDAARNERSTRIVERVRASEHWQRARVVMCFLSMRKEVQTGALLEDAWTHGKRVAVPRVVSDSLDLHEHTHQSPIERVGSLGVPEPLSSAPPVALEEVDLVIVPALAIDEAGHRIGYGGGFYDRTLPRLRAAYRIGVAFDFQLIPEVPVTATDVPVHLVVTDARCLEVPSPASR